MGPLLVEGNTLGQKHRSYNKLVNEAFVNHTNQQIAALNYEEPDLNNLYKIDIACYSRNIEYILEVLKCRDMLYVSRVIKKSTWLITDPEYSYIINPDYLYNTLSRQMTSKAFNKLVLHIRLNLKDENRVEGFFNHYIGRDLKQALKWLPLCSISCIEKIIEKHFDDIPEKMLRRLYEKSITLIEIFVRCYNSQYHRGLLSAMYLLINNVEYFLYIMETTLMTYTPGIGPKRTKIVMKRNPERIMRNIEKYANVLDVSMFAKLLKKDDVKSFILTYIQNKQMGTWFAPHTIKYFLNRLPIDERFDFIKNNIIKMSYEDKYFKHQLHNRIVYHNRRLNENVCPWKNHYDWYVYVPFDRAFRDLKPFIHNASNPLERIGMLDVLITCANSNQQDILTLLRYYREHHINEPFKFKIQFINRLLNKTDTHRYGKEAWGCLNDLFNSMQVYTESVKNVQSCVRSIVLYNIINNENINEVIENKFEYEDFDGKFNAEEKEKIFNFLYKYLVTKIKEDLESKKDYDEAVEILVKTLNFLKVWNKELKDYPLILQQIKYLIIVRNENSRTQDLSGIYNVKKSWRRILFAESITLSPSEDSFLNALKHGAHLLESCKEEINKCYINNKVRLERFFKKIRIWHQSLAEYFKNTFLEALDQNVSNAAVIKGILTLLSQKEALDLIQKYVPTDNKIHWRQPGELSVCKNIAKYMHLARPQTSLSIVLLYSKGDYLQYGLSSLNAVLYNISSIDISEQTVELLNAPVSLQKHGIRAVFSKLKYKELKNILIDKWNSTTNNTIRTDIFCQTYKMMCKETNESVNLEIWELFSVFIDSLTFEENEKIYLVLSKAEDVPTSVKYLFWMKSYTFLEKLPDTVQSARLTDHLLYFSSGIMEFLDVNFMTQIYFKDFLKNFTTEYSYSYNISEYLLSTKRDSVQNERYEKILLPILEQGIAMWDNQYENIYHARNNLYLIFERLSNDFEFIVLDHEMTFPITMYTAALDKLQSSLSSISKIETYILFTHIKLSLAYIKILYNLKTNEKCGILRSDTKANVVVRRIDKWKNLHATAAPLFGRFCLDYLKADIANYFPGIYNIFADILGDICHSFIGNFPINILRVLKVFLECKDFIQGYFVVMKIMPRIDYEDETTAMKLEMVEEIGHHPSEEVTMHYWPFRSKMYFSN